MKKIIFLSFFITFSISLSAQLKVNNYGHVSTGYDLISGSQSGPGVYIGKHKDAHLVTATLGEWGIELTNSALNFWRPYPNLVYGNYYMYISTNGVGIGKVPSYKLDVAGDVATSGAFRVISDARFKKDIQPLLVGDKLYLLEAKSYKKTIPTYTDSIDSVKGFPKEMKKAEKSIDEYGFLAQELKEIFPDLVDENEEGYYTVNYIGLIPIITETLKVHKLLLDAQSEKIKELESIIEKLSGEDVLKTEVYNNYVAGSSGNSSIIDDIRNNSFLYQNAPNPFKERTEIKYYLPDNMGKASICLFDMQGQMLETYSAYQGQNSIIIEGSKLQPGMYLYSLIADGQIVDTKRMVLTK